MKKICSISLVLVAAGLPIHAADLEEPSTNHLNHLTVSARLGFNISANFKGFSTLPLFASSRVTSHGDRYNYDDGYVLSDISGNAGGQTWYWGYDDSSSQRSGNTVLLGRSTVSGGSASQSLDSDPSLGAELVYRRQLGATDRFTYGLEAAANFQDLSFSGNFSDSASVSRRTDAYPFTPGTQPPMATPAAPYQGSFTGPGFVIGDKPVSSTSALISNDATVSGHRRLDADLWGFRLGPYLELPLSERVNVSLSAGAALGLLDSDVSWTQTVSIPGGATGTTAGSGHDFDALFGGYVAANVSWRFSERWSLVGGAQFQALTDYEHSFAGQNVGVTLSSSFFLTLGIGYEF
jgi:hypothetical protein